MKRRALEIIAPMAGAVLFLVTIYVLHHELMAYHVHDILSALKGIPKIHFFAAVIFTVLGYLALTLYDVLAFVYVGRRLPYPKIAIASFIGYAFSNNIGFSFLSGGSIRYRLYSAWQLSPVDIARIVAFCTITGWLGFFTLGGIALLLEPSSLGVLLHMPFHSTHLLGALFLLGVSVYAAASLFRKHSFRFRDTELQLPRPWLVGLQLIVACVDLSLAATVLYMLLPADAALSYPAFLGVFIVAIVAGLVSQVPGGLGVFETLMVVLLSGKVPVTGLLSALLAFRGVYYLLPLIAAAGIFGGHELYLRRTHVARATQAVTLWFPPVMPRLFSIMTFAGGLVLLFSGAVPSIKGRMLWLGTFIPLPVTEMSHFLASLAGVGLILLARGIQQKLDAAYLLSCLLLVCGIAFSLLKGLDYEEAVILSLMLGAMLPCRRYFTRTASVLREPFSLNWILSISVVIGCVFWLGFLSYRHVEYSHDLWWRLGADAPRFMRASVGIVVLLAAFSAARLLRPAPPDPKQPNVKDIERAQPILARCRHTSAHLALMGDKYLLFNDKGTGFLMYGVEASSWVALGDPISPDSDRPELVWRFSEMAKHHGGWPVFYLVQPECLPLYADLGMTMMKLGEEARVHLPEFTLEGSGRKTERHLINKIEREGYQFEVLSKEQAWEWMPRFRAISEQWLQEKNTREKRFSLGFFDEAYLKYFPMAIVRKGDSSGQDAVVAFANILEGAEKEELSIDLMRYAPGAPSGIMEYLIVQLLNWGRGQGYQWFNLGMAPLSGLENGPAAPLWNKFGAMVYRHGEHFYNFQGLRQFKDKFDPVWKPRYLAYPGGLKLPVILTNVATLIAGGIKGVMAK
ncbi:MAG TPA: bifunctional lysylphosphatidylglycerol flippase/synthetase MprF [Candidatus Hydrogenedentes bacterium]|nr:bifunctional lysylphosphatidylglycerol flippase/synthetase MprF [Candidatus Hydrogenedentota bacterium]